MEVRKFLKVRSLVRRARNHQNKGSRNVKIILEFGDEEGAMADMAYKGPLAFSAMEEFRNYLRSSIKYNDELSVEELRAYTKIQEKFFEICGDVLGD